MMEDNQKYLLTNDYMSHQDRSENNFSVAIQILDDCFKMRKIIRQKIMNQFCALMVTHLMVHI